MTDSSVIPIAFDPVMLENPQRDIFDEATGNQQWLRDGKTGRYLAAMELPDSRSSGDSMQLLRVDNFHVDGWHSPHQFRLDYQIVGGRPQQSGLILLRDDVVPDGSMIKVSAASALLRTIGGFDNYADRVWVSVITDENGSFAFEEISKMTENERIGKGVGYSMESTSTDRVRSIFFEERPVRDNIMDRISDLTVPATSNIAEFREQCVLDVLHLFPTLLFLKRDTPVSEFLVGSLDRYLLNLACALVSKPRFLLLDHVLSGANSTIVDIFMATLLEVMTKQTMITLIAERGEVAESLSRIAHFNVVIRASGLRA